MRITQGMIADRTLRNLSANLTRLEGYSNQLTSGKRVSKPSDDPVAVASALSYRATLDQIDQHLKNIDDATAWLNTADSAFNSVGETLQRVNELAVTAANGTFSTEDRQAVKAEVDSLREHMLQLANTTYSDQYIFGGTRTTTPAYTSATPPTYAGDANTLQREIAPGVTVSTNVNGQVVFDPVFTALNDLSTALGANDTAGIAASLTTIQNAQTTLLTARAQVGARVNRLEAQRERLTDLQVNVTELRSKVEDADYASTLLNFSTAQTVYQAALKVGANAVQPSLIDYLR